MADPMTELGGLLLGDLTAEEAARLDAALAGDPALRAEAGSLTALAGALRATAPAPVPEPLRDRVLGAVAAAAADAATPPADIGAARARRRPRLPLAAAAAALIALGVALGAVLAPREERQPGPVERPAVTLASTAGPGTAVVRITIAGEGRIVRLRTDDLPALDNDAEFYELWFVDPRDRPGRPRRVSAGTFHPDAEERVDVILHAAADPAKLPILAVTREPRDGDGAPTAPDVLVSRP